MAASAKPSPPQRGEIVYIEHDPQAGKEMKGRHPLLVLSPRAFNERTGIVIGFPMTHAEYNADNPFAIAIKGPKSEVGYVLCNQPKSFDWIMRNATRHPWGKVPAQILNEALRMLDDILAICPGK